ncbi:MAG: hypothetical protein BroJett033_1160 [Chloroflexota bacterium]|nr:MAG: hypothetical protein BroJett033_1160 [Chloroflexota bacterium]
MVKFMMIFYQPDSVMKFENMYNDLLALVERMPAITRRQVVNSLGSLTGTARIYRILEVYFEDETLMRAALMSARGQEAGAELRTRFPRDSYEIIYAQVYEEAGGHTPQASAPTSAPASAPADSVEKEGDE